MEAEASMVTSRDTPFKGTGARSRAAILCIILSHKAESAICNNSTVSATNKVQFRQESRSLEADL